MSERQDETRPLEEQVPNEERRRLLQGVLGASAALSAGMLAAPQEAAGQACLVSAPPYVGNPVVRRCVSVAEARALLEQVTDPNRVLTLVSFDANNPNVSVSMNMIIMP